VKTYPLLTEATHNEDV